MTIAIIYATVILVALLVGLITAALKITELRCKVESLDAAVNALRNAREFNRVELTRRLAKLEALHRCQVKQLRDRLYALERPHPDSRRLAEDEARNKGDGR